MRADVPDLTHHGEAKIVPMRVAADHSVAVRDTDPRGLPVYGGDGELAGTVVDLWVDRMEMMFRYLEVQTQGGRRVLVPINFRLVQEEVKYIVQHSGARALYIDPELADSLSGVECEHVFVIGRATDAPAEHAEPQAIRLAAEKAARDKEKDKGRRMLESIQRQEEARQIKVQQRRQQRLADASAGALTAELPAVCTR
jgi:hypothetical protein